MAIQSETFIKGYELRERIGAGGFGAVYRAYQSTIGREVAIKVILPGLASQPDFIRRFETEAGIIARLEHPHITPLYDFWRDADGAFLVMRWLRGGSLKEMLREGPFDIDSTAQLLEQISGALALAHRNQVIHRDLKPANILLDEDGNAYLADFGIAKDLGISGSSATSPDAIVGSLDYLSPEQARSEPVTPRTDIYSLGVVLYEMLTGRHPFEGFSPVERMYKHINDPLPDMVLADMNLAQAVNRVIQKATAKNPDLRYPDALALSADFRQAIGFHAAETSERVEETLTPREHDILKLVVEGLSNKEIASRLTFTLGTVKWYVNQIYTKLHVRSRVQAIIRARELNLIGTGAALPGGEMPVTSNLPEPENPYKGLHAFQSADAQDFFGREDLVKKLLKRLDVPVNPAHQHDDQTSRFLAVVGPSGSGKSSLVRAGLIPTLWRGELPGSERWFVVEMIPGTHPLDRLEVGLMRIATNQTGNLYDQLRRDERGLVRIADLILPGDNSELVLIIDQFEEVFSLVEDEAISHHFLNLLCAAAKDPRSRVRIVVTLRADFYDRPLHYAEFGELLRNHMETILPLSARSIERAIIEPARRVGVTFEEGLVATIVSDVNYQAGALPLLQYALTELFEQRSGRLLTHEAYQAIGGAAGALAKRAEAVYQELSEVAKPVARQMFLRLVTPGEGTEDTRRRATRAELSAISPNIDLLDEVIDIYADYRLLSLDNDAETRSPTVEVAHEAMIREWERLREWINESHSDILFQRQLAYAAGQWEKGGRDDSYLLTGTRVAQAEERTQAITLTLTGLERAYLETSIHSAAEKRRREQARQAYESLLERRSVRVLRALAGVFGVAAVIALVLTGVAFNENGRANAALVAEKDARHASDENAASSQNLALINGAQAALAAGDTDLALALAQEASNRAGASLQGQVILAQAAYAPGTIQRFTRQTGGVLSVAFSPDGQIAASSAADHTIYLWDVATGNIIHALPGHYDEVRAVAFSPNGQMLVSASADKDLILWNVATGAVIRRLVGHTRGVNSAVFSPDGQAVLSGGDDGIMMLWDIATGKPLHQFDTKALYVMSVAFHPDGKRILSGSWDRKLRLWDIETGALLRVYNVDAGYVNQAVFTPDGSRILMAASETADIIVWDTESGQIIRRLKGHDGTTISVAIDPTGHMALSGAWDDILILWNLDTGEMLHRFQGHTHGIVSVAFSPDSRYALSASLDSTVRLWDLQGGQITRRFKPLEGQPLEWIVQTRFSPDGTRALTGSLNGVSVLWDVANGTEIRRFEGRNAAFVNDEIALFGTGSWYDETSTGKLRLVDLSTGQELRQEDFGSPVRDIAVAPDGKTFAASYASAFIRLMDVQTGALIQTFEWSQDSGVLAFSPDGTLLAANNAQSGIGIWDVRTGIRTAFLEGHSAFLEGLTFSPDGKTLLSASFDNSVIVWDVATKTILNRFKDHSASAFEAVFSPDGRLIVNGSADRTLIIRDASTGTILRRFTNLRAGIYSLAFSPDGTQLLVGYVDGTLELWHLDSSTDLSAWIHSNRYVPELTCEQRALYRLEPACPSAG